MHPIRSFPVRVLLVLILAFPPASADAGRRQPSVRWSDLSVGAVIHVGLSRSPSFHTLFHQLDASDVVVYVRIVRLPVGVGGQLTFLSAAGGHRYVQVSLALDQTVRQQVAALGHELQHALEIAQRPDIVDASSMAAAFRTLGFERHARARSRAAFDTYAAIEAGNQVWREMEESATSAD